MSRRVLSIHALPNIVTSGNLFSGFYAILSVARGDFETACLAIFLAGIFDLLDGRVARMTKTDSKFGMEYDSLCDLVSFGVAPAFLMYAVFLKEFDKLGFLATFMIVLCGALRLARFNVDSSRLPKSYFMGLPIPMAAATIVGFYLFFGSYETYLSMKTVTVGFSLFVSFLMVSTFRFASFKDFHPKRRSSIFYFVTAAFILGFVAVYPRETLFGALISYILVNLVWDIYRIAKRKKVK